MALSGLTGLARMLIREGKDQVKALEYLALVTNNPATDAQTTEAAQQLINTLRDELPPDVVELALETGKELKLRDVAQKILAES